MVVVESFGRGLFSAVDSLLLEIKIFRRAKSFLKGEDEYSRDFLSRVQETESPWLPVIRTRDVVRPTVVRVRISTKEKKREQMRRRKT